MIDLESRAIFDLSLSPDQAAIRRLEKLSEKAADIASVEDNVGADENLLAELEALKKNMENVIETLTQTTISNIVIAT